MKPKGIYSIIATVFLVSIPALVAARTPHIQVQGTAVQNDASRIAITNVFAFTAVSGNPFVGQYISYPVECVFFKDTAPVAATHVRFYFVYTDAQGNVVGKDYIDSRGKFSTGVDQEMLPLFQAPVPGKQCRDLPGGIDGDKMRYGKSDVTLSAYVDEVDFADGSSWHAPTPAPSATPSATPSPTASP